MTTLKLHRQGYENLLSEGADDDTAFNKSSLSVTKNNLEHTLDVIYVNHANRSATFEYFTSDNPDEEPYVFTLVKDQLEQLEWFDVRAGWFGKNDVELVLMAELDVTFKRADIKKVKE